MTVKAPEKPQHLTALEHANEVRLAAARLKRDLAAGRVTVRQALRDPRAGCLTTLDLLMAQHRWGRQRAVRVLTPNLIPELKRIRDLTDRQVEILADACR